MNGKSLKRNFIKKCLFPVLILINSGSFSLAASLDHFPPTSHALRVGVYSGSFDPPHLGHYKLMQIALNHGLDYVLMIPNGRMAHKPNASPFSDRLTMTQIMASQEERILVPSEPKTPEAIIESSMEIMTRLAPKTFFVGIIGSDVADLMSGRTPGYIAEQNAVWTDKIQEWIVGGRTQDYVAPANILGRPVTRSFLDATKNLPSSQIRQTLIHDKVQLAQAVGEPVAEWIMENFLYQQNRLCRNIFK